MLELEQVYGRIRSCMDCGLCNTRTQAVPGEGPGDAEVMFVGEGPGFHEDQQARPFVGPAGKLLDDLLALGGLKRGDVYITNVVKCRPPNNRDPLPNEVDACKKHLEQQMALINPKLVVTLGRYSLSWFFPRDSISKVHGHLRRQNGTYFLHMYHPAAALHAGNLRRTIEDDFRKIPQALNKIREAEQPVAVAEAATEQMRLF